MYANSNSRYTHKKTYTKFASASPMSVPSRRSVGFLRLVEEAAALEHARAFLGGDFDVARRQQEDLVGDALHAAVERVGEPAREVDQSLRQVLVGALEVDDHR